MKALNHGNNFQDDLNKEKLFQTWLSRNICFAYLEVFVKHSGLMQFSWKRVKTVKKWKNWEKKAIQETVSQRGGKGESIAFFFPRRRAERATVGAGDRKHKEAAVAGISAKPSFP